MLIGSSSLMEESSLEDLKPRYFKIYLSTRDIGIQGPEVNLQKPGSV